MKPTCPYCGEPVDELVRDAIAGQILRWQQEGLLQPDVAERLRVSIRSDIETPPTRFRRGFTPAMALVLVGGILVVCAAVLAMASLWESLTQWARFGVVGMPTILLYAAGIALRRTRLTSLWLSDGLTLIGAFLVPLAVWLLLGLFVELPNPGGDAAVSWLSVTGGVSFVLQASTAAGTRAPIHLLPPSLTLLWLALILPITLLGEPRGENWIPWAILGAGLFLLMTGRLFHRSGHTAHSLIPNIVGALALPFGGTILAAKYEGAFFAIAIVIPLTQVLLASVPSLRAMLWPGAVFLIFNIFHIGLARFQHSVGLPLSLLGCGLASLLVGYLVHRIQRDSGGAGRHGAESPPSQRT